MRRPLYKIKVENIHLACPLIVNFSEFGVISKILNFIYSFSFDHHSMSYALTEVPAGFAIVRVQGETPALHSLHKFKSSKEAVDSTVALVQSDLSKPLKKFLKTTSRRASSPSPSRTPSSAKL